MLGTRGVPARYGGFETCVEQLGSRLVERGHEVTVYCRRHYQDRTMASYKGMELVTLPTIRNKYLETPVHAFLSSIHALGRRYDAALYFIAGNSLVSWIPRLVGTQTILNVDGLDWKRRKWNRFAKAYLQAAESLATWLPNDCVTDSAVVRAYYESKHRKRPHFIPYGSELPVQQPGETLRRLGLEPRRYILFVGRLVPENCPEHLVDAFRGLDTDVKCVIVGGAAYADDYIKWLKRRAGDDPRILFTGYLFGRSYQELLSSAYAFVASTGVGGTHPAILEAMGLGNCVVVNGIAENRETIGAAGLSYDGSRGGEGLRQVLERLLGDPDLVERLRDQARTRARSAYAWEEVVGQYERLILSRVNGTRRKG